MKSGNGCDFLNMNYTIRWWYEILKQVLLQNFFFKSAIHTYYISCSNSVLKLLDEMKANTILEF